MQVSILHVQLYYELFKSLHFATYLYEFNIVINILPLIKLFGNKYIYISHQMT